MIKGSSRGQSRRDVRCLADHLLNRNDNEIVELIEIRGVAALDLHAALAEMRAVSLGSRTRKALYHASINIGRDEAPKMSRSRWLESIAELEWHLGMVGHPRAILLHRKREREHVHIVWSRIHPASLRTASDSHNYRRHEETARSLEARFGLHQVVGAHTRPEASRRPVARATHADWQAAERTEIAVADVAARIRGAWHESNNGRAFVIALQARDLSLARGRRGLLVIDEAGTPHSIPRRLGCRAAEVRAKLADLEHADIMEVANAQRRTRSRRKEAMEKATRNTQSVLSAVSACAPVEIDWNALESWWRQCGFDPVREWDCLWIDAYGATYRDYGNRIELVGDGSPTDEQIAALVTAGKERGWSGIHFEGPPEFQRRARLEALRQGFPPEAISLECEKESPSDIATPAPEEPMPEHVRRALGLLGHSGPEVRDHRTTKEKHHEQDAEESAPRSPRP